MVQRVYLAGLAVAPALAVLALPAAAIGVPATFALGGAGSLVALVTSLRQTPSDPESELNGSLLRKLPSAAYPPVDELRQKFKVATAQSSALLTAPPNQEQSIAKVIACFVSGWGDGNVAKLTDRQVLELEILTRLLKAEPYEAGSLSQHFQRPDLMLDLRDEIQTAARNRALHDRNVAALTATQQMWSRQSDGSASVDLLTSLKELDAPDPDLWHRVVQSHDRTDPVQREAALWCIEQPECDRATVALYLAHLSADGGLHRAAERGDEAFLSRVRAVIEGLNDGLYDHAELALEPTDAVAADGARFSEALDDLAEITNRRRWPEPCGLFTDYPGRAPHSRKHWRLSDGGLTEAPDPRDYVPLPLDLA